MAACRLDKLIASQLGLSRREAGALIRQGFVRVDGAAASRPDVSVDPGRSAVEVKGRPVAYSRFMYLMLNKPPGYVCSTRDGGSPTVLELVPPELFRKNLFPAGRLDKLSEGFVLLTDDGDLAHRILSPRRHVKKRYYVKLDKPVIDEELSARFARGVPIDGGEICLPALLEPINSREAYVTLRQGLYHQLRRMFARQGAEVTRLVRLQIGGLPMDPGLLPGRCRALAQEEVLLLAGGLGTDAPPEQGDQA
jgi:16S rRNA pseudouridine516 synthase